MYSSMLLLIFVDRCGVCSSSDKISILFAVDVIIQSLDSLYILFDDDNSDGLKKLNPVIVEDASILLPIEQHDTTDDLFNVKRSTIALLSDKNISALIFLFQVSSDSNKTKSKALLQAKVMGVGENEWWMEVGTSR